MRLSEECGSNAESTDATKDAEDEPEADAKERKSAYTSLKASSAAAIFKCAEEAEARDIVLAHGGLTPLVALVRDQPDNAKLMEGVTGAIWKCAKNAECNAVLVEAKACENLVPLLTNKPETVIIHVVGALSELAANSTDPRSILHSRSAAPRRRSSPARRSGPLVGSTTWSSCSPAPTRTC